MFYFYIQLSKKMCICITAWQLLNLNKLLVTNRLMHYVTNGNAFWNNAMNQNNTGSKLTIIVKCTICALHSKKKVKCNLAFAYVTFLWMYLNNMRLPCIKNLTRKMLAKEKRLSFERYTLPQKLTSVKKFLGETRGREIFLDDVITGCMMQS